MQELKQIRYYLLECEGDKVHLRGPYFKEEQTRVVAAAMAQMGSTVYRLLTEGAILTFEQGAARCLST